MKPLEDGKDAVGVLWFDPDAVVGYGEPPFAVLAGRGDFDPGGLVPWNLMALATRFSNSCTSRVRRLAPSGTLPVTTTWAPACFDSGGQVHAAPVPRPRCSPPRSSPRRQPADSGISQQIVDQLLHAVRAVNHVGDVLIGLPSSLALVSAGQQLAETGHLAQRLLQVMRRDIRELLQFCVRGFELARSARPGLQRRACAR